MILKSQEKEAELMILKLQEKEAELMKKYSNDGFSSDTDLISAITSLLDSIASCSSEIMLVSELKWAGQATVRWESFLRSKFDIWRSTALPTLSNLPQFKADLLHDKHTPVGLKDVVIGDIEEFEESILNLNLTFIVSSSPKVPKNGLRDVMKKKVAIDKTKYIFLLSRSVTNKEKIQLHGGFYTLFEEAISEYKIYGSKPNDFVGIYSLGYDWISYPYVFYHNRNDCGKRTILALRGSEKGVAISDPYFLIPSDYAHDLWTAITSQEPKEDELREEFMQMKKDVDESSFSSGSANLKLVESFG